MDSLLKNYEIGQTLGTGAFSEVKQATDKRTGKKYAIKIVDKSKCAGKESMIMSEVNILKRVKHENIISLVDMIESGSKLYLVMELVTGGELFDKIVERGHYNETESARIVQKILSAVDYLHEMDIAHRDLKPENLMFSEPGPNGKIMIGDFGLSKIFDEEEVMKTACGTPGYVAPEVLRRQGYSSAVDLWSIGVITYILLVGYPPFYEENNVELFQVIMRGEYEFDSPYWDNISQEAKDFISKLLVVDPKRRMDTKTALKHSFITKRCPPLTIAPPPVSSVSMVQSQSPVSPAVELETEPEADQSIFDARSVESLNSLSEDEEEKSHTQKPFERTDTALGPTSRPNDRQETAINVEDIAAKARNINIGDTSFIRVLSYNLCIRPPFVKANSNDYKDARLQTFIDNHLSSYDIVILQDVFARGSTRQKKLINQAKKVGLSHYLRSPASGLLKGIVDGGLVILSRFPIILSNRTTFEKGLNNDRFIAKGAIHARVEVAPNRIVDVFNTSFQESFASSVPYPSDPICQKRLKQAYQLREFMTSCLDYKLEYPVIVAGDFKTNARDGTGHSAEFRDILSILKGGKVDSEPVKEAFQVPFDDLLYQRFKEHPVTFGDSGDPTAKSYLEGRKRNPETVLTEKVYTNSNQSPVHLFSAKAVKKAGTTSSGPHLQLSEITLSPFLNDASQEYSHLSDHYGIVAKFSLQD